MRRGLFAGALLAVVSALDAHPFAVTLAEAEYNADRKVLEISLRVYPEQLERALTLWAGEKIELARAPEIDTRIAEYLTAHFLLTDSSSSKESPLSLVWVGKEMSAKEVWLYFEIAMPLPLDGKSLSNTLLFEANKEQLNIVNFKEGTRRATTLATRARPQSVLRFREGKTKPSRAGNGLDF